MFFSRSCVHRCSWNYRGRKTWWELPKTRHATSTLRGLFCAWTARKNRWLGMTRGNSYNCFRNLYYSKSENLCTPELASTAGSSSPSFLYVSYVYMEHVGTTLRHGTLRMGELVNPIRSNGFANRTCEYIVRTTTVSSKRRTRSRFKKKLITCRSQRHWLLKTGKSSHNPLVGIGWNRT